MDNLITSQEAKIAWANGLEVEYYSSKYPTLGWGDANELHGYEFDLEYMKFRLKPTPLLLNSVELPTPFEPKIGELYYLLSPYTKTGYTSTVRDADTEVWTQYGAWRTEEEIKQVVPVLRQIMMLNT